MASERVARILRSKSQLSEEEIEALSDADAWRLVYSSKPTRPKARQKSQVCFTGFSPSDKEALTDRAERNGFRVVKSVIKKLSYLCIGDDPGPAKLGKAQEQGATVLTVEQFLQMLGTGEVP